MGQLHNHGAAVWQGFDFEWRRTPHRLNHIGCDVTGAYDPDAEVLRGAHEARFSVGRVPDRGVARMFVTGIRSRALKFLDGEVGTLLEGQLGRPAKVVGERVEVPLPGIPFDHVATVVLRGFELTCTSCPVGLHTQGFGLRLDDVVRTAEGLSFVPTFEVHASNSPDPITLRYGPYAYAAIARYTVIAGPRTELAVVEAPLRHRQTRRGPEVSELSLPAGEDERAVLAIRGFRWAQVHQGRWGRDGRFVRRIQACLPPSAREGGLVKCRPELLFSNRGAITYTVEAEHELYATLLRYRDDRPPLPHLRLDGDIPTGIGAGAVHRGEWVLG